MCCNLVTFPSLFFNSLIFSGSSPWFFQVFRVSGHPADWSKAPEKLSPYRRAHLSPLAGQSTTLKAFIINWLVKHSKTRTHTHMHSHNSYQTLASTVFKSFNSICPMTILSQLTFSAALPSLTFTSTRTSELAAAVRAAYRSVSDCDDDETNRTFAASYTRQHIVWASWHDAGKATVVAFSFIPPSLPATYQPHLKCGDHRRWTILKEFNS